MRIAVIGDLNLDIAVASPETLPAGGEVRSEIRTRPGGSAGTFARHAAGCGAEVVFVGCVGEDIAGEMLVRSLVDAGVEPRVVRSTRPTGAVLALWGEGERTMVCSRGANDDLDGSGINREFVRGVDHVHVSGYALLSPPQRKVAVHALLVARRLGRSTSVDPPPASLIEAAGIGRFREDVRGVDLLLPNLAEARTLTGAREVGPVVDALAAQHAAGAVTLGADGACAWSGDRRCVRSVEDPVDVDSTGAGDVYGASFVVSFLKGVDLDEVNQRAVAAARRFLALRLAS